MDNQINELSKGEKTNNSPNKYNLRSKKKEVKSDIPDHPSKLENPIKDVARSNKENKAQNPSATTKGHLSEVTKILNPSSYFTLRMKFKRFGSLIPFQS
jgi:hypothetical protein